MDFHPDARSLLDDYTREAARRSGLPEPARSEGRIELQSHLAESAAAKATADGMTQVQRNHVREAIGALGTEAEVDVAFFAGHRTGTPAANWGARVGAVLLDFLILAVVSSLLVAPFSWETGSTSSSSGAASYSCSGFWFFGMGFGTHEQYTGSTNPCDALHQHEAIHTLVFAVLALLYFGLMEGYQGRTLGKMALGLRTVRADGQTLTIGQAFGRNAVKALPPLVFLDWIIGMMAFSGQHLRLSDQAAGTRVVKT